MSDLIAIVGSRPDATIKRGRSPADDARRLAVRDYVHGLAERGPAPVIITGGAAGVDTWAEEAALDYGLVVVRCIPPWARLGKRAGYVRNAVVVDICTRLVAFWNGTSVGTGHAIELARKAGKLSEVFT